MKHGFQQNLHERSHTLHFKEFKNKIYQLYSNQPKVVRQFLMSFQYMYDIYMYWTQNLRQGSHTLPFKEPKNKLYR